MKPIRAAAISAVIWAIGLCPMAMADSIFTGSIERKDVKILAYRNGYIEFSISGRAVDPVPAEKVSRIVVDDEPAFTAAEKAFVGGKWADAAVGYQKAIKTSTKAWLKDWSLPRMVQAGDSAGRVDIAVSGFVQLIQKDPQQVKARPKVPADADVAMLKSAADDLNKAAANGALSNVQKQAILSLLLDVTRAQGDLTGAGKVGEQLLKISNLDPADPANAAVLADVHLGMARLALAQKDYAKAANEIRANKTLFTEPSQQAEAFYCLALVKDAQAGEKPSAQAMKDIVIEYLRAAGVSRLTPEKRHLPECLVRVAQIQEQLGDLKSAGDLYAEVAGEYKDSPLAAKAKADSDRINAKLK